MQPRLSPMLFACIVVAAGIVWIASLRIPPVSAAPDTLAPSHEQSGPTVEKSTAQSRPSSHSKADPFWPVVEAPKPVVMQVTPIAPPPLPLKPTLPFKFFGRVTNPDGRQAIFVSRENEQYEIKPDAILEGQFKVVSINDAQIVFEHIASGEKLEMTLPPVPRNNSGSGL